MGDHALSHCGINGMPSFAVRRIESVGANSMEVELMVSDDKEESGSQYPSLDVVGYR